MPSEVLAFRGAEREITDDQGTFRYQLHFEKYRIDPKEARMATQIVMDHSGDTRHFFEASNPEALAEAEERFKALVGEGFTAAVRDQAGLVTTTRSFDPTAQETLFYPRLVGG